MADLKKFDDFFEPPGELITFDLNPALKGEPCCIEGCGKKAYMVYCYSDGTRGPLCEDDLEKVVTRMKKSGLLDRMEAALKKAKWQGRH